MISLQSKGLSRGFSNATVRKHQSFGTQNFSMVQLSHPHMTTRKTVVLTLQTFVGKVMSVLYNVLSRFVRLPRASGSVGRLEARSAFRAA